MQIKKWLLLVVFLVAGHFAFSQQNAIDIDVNEVPLTEVFNYLEKNYNYLFSFKIDDIKNVVVSAKFEHSDIDSVLSGLLNEVGLEYELINQNYIIIKRLNDDFTEKKSNLSFKYCGLIVDNITEKPLPFASIYFKKNKSGNYASENGKFSFLSHFEPEDTLVVSYVGYQDKYFPVHYFAEGNCPTISMSYFDYGEDFIVVTDYLTDGVDLADNGSATVMRPNRIGALPGQVDPDVFSTIQFLPGINSPSGDASSLNVRGGAADQNLILWEGVPIYHAAHFFGMISAFNPYVIDKIKVHRGGFGSSFGGRISSVIELESPDKKPASESFGAGMNFINAYTHGVLSMGKKLAAVYSVRRSISELWRSPTFDNIAFRNQQSLLQVGFDVSNIPKRFEIQDEFRFWEGHAKLMYDLSDKSKLAIVYFYNDNNFDDEIIDPMISELQIDRLNLVSHGGSIKWESDWSSIYKMDLLASFSDYNYDYLYDISYFGMGQRPGHFGFKRNNVTESQINWSNSVEIFNNNELKVGYNFTHYDVSYQIRHEKAVQGILANERDSFNAPVHAVFIELKSDQRKKTGIDIGARISSFGLHDGLFWSPRFRLWHNISESLSFHLNAGKYRQFISQLVEFKGDRFGFDTPVWVMAGNREAPILGAIQIQSGLLFNKNSWVIDLQGYLKKTKGLTSLAIGFDTNTKKPEHGDSFSKGIDLLIKKRWRNVRSWVSYSLSSTDFHFPEFFDTDFPAPYDVRHAIQWAGQLKVSSFDFSVGFQALSGVPYSKMVGFNEEQGQMGEPKAEPIYEAFNSYRIPWQHNLNASVVYNFEIGKNTKKMKGAIGFSMFNIYGQNNIYSREYSIETPHNSPWFIVESNVAGLKRTPNMMVRFAW